MYGKMSVLNASITSCLLFNNFSAAFNVSSLDFIFFRFVGLQIFSFFNTIFFLFCPFSASLSKLLLPGADAGFQKSQSKFLKRFLAQPYLGYLRYQLRKYQFFSNLLCYYYYRYYYCYIIICIIIIIIIIFIIIIIVSAKILERCVAVGLYISLACQSIKPSHKEVLLLTYGRLLWTHFCLQPFFHKDSVSLQLAQFYLYIQVSSQLINLFLRLFLSAEAQLVHRLSGAAATCLGITTSVQNQFIEMRAYIVHQSIVH